MNKAVIFDLDGTLLNTLPDISININIMLSKFGYKNLDSEIIKKYIGNGAKKIVQRSIGIEISEDKLQTCLKFYNEIYTSSKSPNTKPFDGIEEVLSILKQKGYKLGILTNKPQETTDTVYDKFFKKFNFDKVVGYKNGIKCKPEPTELLKMLKELEVEPENTFFVGDGETDVEVSNNAKVKGIAVLWGYRDKQTLIEAGAKTFALSTEDLLRLIY